jgi:hypothetical protein
MPLVKNEQTEKRDSAFLKYENENTLMILSNLYKIDSHYLKAVNKFVACHTENCEYCLRSIQKKMEYNYIVNLNGKEGMMDIKPSVFYNINAMEKAFKKDKRYISWMVIKSGSGLDTEYTVSKDDNLTTDDIERVEGLLEDNNKKLSKIMLEREKRLEEEYKLNLKRDQEDISSGSVDPDDVPF